MRLAALVDKSLIRRTLEETEVPRYELHELLRQYALAKLQEDPDEEARTRDRHCAYYARQLGDRTGPFYAVPPTWQWPRSPPTWITCA